MPSESFEKKILNLAISSRLVLFLVQLVSNFLLPDHNAGVFKKPVTTHGNDFDKFIGLLFDGYSRWDGQYFLHIAQHGYTYENTTAFFPLFPLVVRFFGTLLQTVLPFQITTHSSLLIAAVIFNNVIFVWSSLILFKLSLLVLGNEKMAYTASMLFCVNPASIFFSAVYSESLYFFLSVNAMWFIEKGKIFEGSLLVGLSAVTRSNGILNSGYFAYRCLRTWRGSPSIFFQLFILFFSAFFLFALYQGFCFFTFCLKFDPDLPSIIQSHARRYNFVLPGKGDSEWCNSTIPLAYSYVQKHYWDVGFLRYFQMKQIPNFILALPIIIIVCLGTYRFIRTHKTSIVFLGFKPGVQSYLPVTCFPYIVHAYILTVFSFFCAHVQVTTRLLCASGPVVYWIIASSLINFNDKGVHGSKRAEMWKKSLLTQQYTGEQAVFRYYFFAYFLAGTFAFSNHLPWT